MNKNKKVFSALLLSIILLLSGFSSAIYANGGVVLNEQNNLLNEKNAETFLSTGGLVQPPELTADDILDISDYGVSTVANDTQTNETKWAYTIEDAAKQLRKQLAEHANEAYVYYKSPTPYDSSTFQSEISQPIWDTALEHTGVPTEGDYISWHRSDVNIGGTIESDCYFTLKYVINWYTTKEQEDELDAAIKAVFSQISEEKGYDIYNASDYLKVCAIYDYICKNISYDHSDSKDMLKYTAYAAMIKKSAVCQGYASLFYRMSLTLGVDTRLITGEGNGGAHGWNIVKLHGKYYNIDATWDTNYAQSGTKYAYFLKSNDNFSDHLRNDDYNTDEFNNKYPMGTTDYVPVDEDYATNAADLLAPVKYTRLSLSDKISIKFLVKLDDKALNGGLDNDADNDYMKITIDGKALNINVNDAKTETRADGIYRVFEAELNSKQMTKDVSVCMYIDGAAGTVKNTSVKKYADTIINDETGTYTSADKAMVKAILNYGGYAQRYFDGAVDNLANEGLYNDGENPVLNWDNSNLEPYTHTVVSADDTKGISIDSTTLLLESQTELRIYFTLEDGKSMDDYTFSLNGAPNKVRIDYNSTKKKYYAAIEDIGPAALDTMYTLTVIPKNETDAVIKLTYSALSYVKTVQELDTTSASLKQLMKALYYYNVQADAYNAG